jgi:hypothetical protein
MILDFGDLLNDQCIDANWIILKEDLSEAWEGNPAIDAPHISFFPDPVIPCIPQYYTFYLEPDIWGECLCREFPINVDFVSSEPPAKCPTQIIFLKFPCTEDVKEESEILNFLVIDSDNKIFIFSFYMKSELIIPTSVKIFDIEGRIIPQRIQNLSTDLLVNASLNKNQLYFIEIVYNNGMVKKGKFIK